MSQSILPNSKNLIHLDGTTLEGGGQLLRLSLSLSSLSRRPFHVTDIRGKRGPLSNPGQAGGIKPAHLAGAQWLARATSAETDGMELKSRELVFRPSNTMSEAVGELPIESDEPKKSSKSAKKNRSTPVKSSSHEQSFLDVFEDGILTGRESQINIGTPGSIFAVLQAVLPFVLFSDYLHPQSHTADASKSGVPLQLTVDGGTHVSHSPTSEYTDQVLLPILSTKLGLPCIQMRVKRRGWTTGRTEMGRVVFEIKPQARGQPLPNFTLSNRGDLVRVHVSILAPGEKARRSIRAQVTEKLLALHPDVEIVFPVEDESQNPKRFYLLLVAETSNGYRLGRDWLYDGKGRNSTEEKVDELSSRVVRDLQMELAHGGCVDEYMQDQLVVFQCLASGMAIIDDGRGREASLHTRTARWIAEQLLGVHFDEKGHCEGVGFKVGEKYWEREENGMQEVIAETEKLGL